MLDTPYPSVHPGPPRPSRILTPRDLERHHGRERHVIPGGGALMLRLGVGDRLTLVNDEGGQMAELVAAAMILGPVVPRGEISFLLDRDKVQVTPHRLSVDNGAKEDFRMNLRYARVF